MLYSSLAGECRNHCSQWLPRVSDEVTCEVAGHCIHSYPPLGMTCNNTNYFHVIGSTGSKPSSVQSAIMKHFTKRYT